MQRTRVKTSLLVLGFALSSATGAVAATPELSFYPASAWQAGLAAPATALGGQSCAVQTKFNNGFVMRFDGSSRWVEALSVNFRQEIFETGQTYDVTLSAPGEDTQSFPATAANPMLLNINLQGHKELYKAMRDNAVLDMNVEGNSFRFYLTGFSAGAKHFEQCMAGGSMKSDTVQEAQMNAAPDMTVNESIAYEQKEAARLEAKSQMQEEYAASMSMDDTITEHERHAITEIDMRTEAATMSAPPQDDMTGTFIPDDSAPQPLLSPAQEPAENTRTASYKPAEFPAEAYEPAETMPPRRGKTAREERQPFTASAAAPAPDMTSADMASPDMTPMDKEPVGMEPVYETSAPAPAPEAETPPQRVVKKVDVPEPARMKVHKETRRMEADFTGLDDMEPASADPMTFANDGEYARKISELESKLQMMERENAALNDELQLALSESEQERLDISTDNWNLERATMRYNEAERQIKKLGMQLQKERAHCSVEKKELEAMLFDPQVTSQQQLARLTDLEEKLARTEQKLADQRLQYEERLKILQDQTTQ